MTTDRELLEAAARAAGIVLDTARPGEVSDKQCHARVWDRGGRVTILFYSDSRDHPMCRKPSTPGNVEWSPLTDDGDALRLAMKLHPDKGGTDAQMGELNAARDEALQELGP